MNAAELQLIGALCARPDGVYEVDVLPEHFGSQAAELAYRVIVDLSSSGSPVDLLAVGLEMRSRTGRDWMPWLSQAYSECLAASNAKFYGDQVRTGYTLRQAREIAGRLMNGIEATNSADHIDAAIASLMELRRTKSTHEWSGRQALADALEVIKERMAKPDGVSGIPTGLRDLDSTLGGLQETDLIVVGARSGMGKTAFVLNLAMNAGHPVGVISSEQGYRQIGERLYAIAGKVDTRRMRTGDMDDNAFHMMAGAVAFRDWEAVRINDNPSISIMDVSRQAREWAHKFGIKALYVDYLQRIQPTDKSLPRREQIDEVVIGLKNIARELRIPVVALAQVNRSVEQRADPRPTMSDLKESGKIEEESDVILTLYREDYYKPDTPRKGIVEVDIVKNRHGPTGCIDTVWRADCLRFEDMAGEWG